MIESFGDKLTERVMKGEYPKGLPAEIIPVARRKLRMLDAATELRDLESPPGNRLHRLVGDRKGQWAIRINRQYRICFYWVDGNAQSVQIIDYHK